MSKIGYIRVSSEGQNTKRQEVALKEIGVEKIFIEKISGKDINRPQLQKMLEYIREEDIVYIESISRLGKNLKNLLENEYILSISTNELIIKLVDVWKKIDILNRRIHIIEKCIKSYVEGEYWLFIPTMLAQLEGTVIDIFDIKGKYVIEDLKEKVDKLVDLTREQFDSNARSFYIDIILSGFEVGKECEALSRHSILHGYNTEYGTKVNALKIIYFFDHVIWALYYASDFE